VRVIAIAVLLAVWFSPVLAEDAPKTAAAKGPRLSVEPASFDFGKAVQNKTLQKEFSIRNFGGSDLVIENVSTTCGCTAALLSDKVVKPGSSTPLRVSLETRNYSGKMERTVLIRSNDPEASTTEVKVSVTVVAEPEK
jgi:hypothetical protein